ncbi:hypothetical protein H5410_061438 [Solanum commersonii]|uniref:Uncharacterized protein n=1 Tax=Solanum commersonii TaxID=4109 RepID=A0A9J5W957_SOLCO|nr:hypothetical protein H5410_061438 [Solanum commersonii]
MQTRNRAHSTFPAQVLKHKACISPSPVGESSISLEITFCSSVLSPKGKDQVGDEMKQSACRRVVPQSSTISPNDSKCKEAED